MKTFLQPLSAREERECLKRYKEGDQEAREILINRNMRLVAHVIKKYQSPDYEMEDLLSVGTIGLIKAVNTFDVRGKVILQPHGKEFFTWYSKHLFTLHGKHFFT